MANSQELFYSEYGIVDVSPSKRLHDRTRRAMVNGRPFLSSANLEDSFPDIERFETLFFNFLPGNLAMRCAKVVSDPREHSDVSEAFARAYHDRFHLQHFVQRLDSIAMLSARYQP